MVRWQEALYRTRPELSRLDCSRYVVTESQKFIGSFQQQKARRYPELLQSLHGCFEQTARTGEKYRGSLQTTLAALGRKSLSIAALEKAHREFLLAPQDAVGAVPNRPPG